ncbi:hypothetical protein L1987_59896 [Smallanthus sonchifolius]|uniref:Uncharacterized protein n=1 Tax=Smallanthus sonchifolius TaxID=185202 RepID=A0ACB9D6S0_9ASTR|nr:hypothetical protein L1987_59896 [Smallanthus sonchifolius]
MNTHHKSNQNPAVTSASQQVNPVITQQMFNGNVGGLFPNNMPIVAPPSFMSFPNQPFPLQNATGQFPNGIGGFNPQQNFNPFPVNQFNPSQQPHGQFFIHNSMNPTAYPQNVGLPGEQVLLQNTIQNIYQLLQLQNPNYTQCPPGNFPMFQNQIVNVMNPQNPGFPVNHQFGMSSSNGPEQHANHGPQNTGQHLQGNPFLPSASGSVQTQQPQNLQGTLANFQNQIPQGVGPQNQNLFTNQMFGATNLNNPMQNQPGFVTPMMDVNASRQMVNVGQTHNPSSSLTNFEGNHKNMFTNANGGWTESQHKNFTGHKTYDASHKGSKFNKHGKEKFGIYKGNMSRGEGDNNLAVDPVSRNFTNFEKKVSPLNYTEQEIKEWREARKKNFPTNGTILKKQHKEHTSSDATNQEAMLRRQQLKEILAKQAELGCEVADISASYLSGPDKQNPREKKHERRQKYKKAKFHNKRGTSFQDVDRIAKKSRPRDQDSFKNKPNKREPSLLQKLLTQDIKRDKSHLLQVLRFITANSFFTGESLRFPSVIVRETNVDVPAQETERTCSVMKVEEEEEGEIID